MNRPEARTTEAPAEAPPASRALAHFEELRPRLFGVAYGLLGSVTEAEDVLQDAWIRLQRKLMPVEQRPEGALTPNEQQPEGASMPYGQPQSDTDSEQIEDLTGWLITTTSRLALDVLRAARTRREAYVGPWLPEPVETAPDPADSVSLADAMSWAMLVVLETLSPAERAAFVLHDVFGLTFDEVGSALGRSPAACRKLASRAREHVEERKPRFNVDPQAHRAVVEAFSQATRSGDLDGLLELLDPKAVLTSDGGGLVRAARNPIRGADKVARFLVGLSHKYTDREHRPIVINGSPALITVGGGIVDGVIALGIEDGRITTVDYLRNPQKFAGLRTTQAEQ